jgi:bacillithiol biosynthesis cysteine-adding enzyme BshC
MDIFSLSFFTPLAKDYLARFDESPIHNYFAISPNAPHEQLRAIIDRRVAREKSLPASHRAMLVHAIEDLHRKYDAITDAVRQNLDALKKPECVAVVTGQQVGILGGPMYTFFKTFTTIELAKKLAAEYPGISFVPVFWLETEDHDLDEISITRFLDGESQLRTLRYAKPIEDGKAEAARKQAARVVLEAEPLAQVLAELRSALPPTAFTSDILALAERCYKPGATFEEAFTALMLHYFADDGLLFLDANRKDLKELAKPLFRTEIESSPQLSEQIVLQSVHLEETYHAQVKPRALNLFYVDDDGDRMAIVERERTTPRPPPSKGGGEQRSFFLKGTRKTFTLAELVAELDAHPERFSPNVVMRPLYQDSLLPTVAYVAGPGEIAYFAQFKPSYDWAGLPMPLIHPRISATLVEERFERIFAKYHISAEDVLSDVHARNQSLFDLLIDSELVPKFEASIGAIDRELEALRDAVNKADATLDGALTSLKGKVLTAIRDFQGKTVAAERKRHTTTKAQLDKLLAALLPAQELQERELNLLYFLNKYGPDFLRTLKSVLPPLLGKFDEHHIIHLSEVFNVATNTDGASEIVRTSAPAERLGAR